MAGHRSAEGHFGGVLVADFTDQDDVGVLPHDRADAVGEIELQRFVDRALAHQRDRVFDRVFQRHDVDGLVVQVRQHRIQRGGLAGTGRPGHQQDAFGTRHHQLQLAPCVFGEAHLLQRHDGFFAVEDAQHQVFAVDAGLRRHAEVDRAAVQRQGHAAVLRRARLGDVHPGQHFEPHQDAGPVGLVQAADLFEHAVDAVADAQEGVLGLEVDVGGFALHRVGQQRADQPHHRLGVFLGVGVEAGVIDFAGFDFAQDAVEREVEAVELVDAFQQLRFGRQQGVDFELAAERGAQLVERDDVEHVGGRQRQHVARGVMRDRQQVVAAGEFLGHQLQRLGVGHHLGEIDALAAERVGELVAQHRLGHEA